LKQIGPSNPFGCWEEIRKERETQAMNIRISITWYNFKKNKPKNQNWAKEIYQVPKDNHHKKNPKINKIRKPISQQRSLIKSNHSKKITSATMSTKQKNSTMKCWKWTQKPKLPNRHGPTNGPTTERESTSIPHFFSATKPRRNKN
jgi:hypothetical protein